MKNGLKRPGDKAGDTSLEVVEGHIPLGNKLYGH